MNVICGFLSVESNKSRIWYVSDTFYVSVESICCVYCAECKETNSRVCPFTDIGNEMLLHLKDW